MKDLIKTKICLGLLIEHLSDGIFVHHASYTKKILNLFYLEKAHPLSTLMVVQSLDVKNDLFHPKEDNEEILGLEVSYLSAVGALMYLCGNIRFITGYSSFLI